MKNSASKSSFMDYPLRIQTVKSGNITENSSDDRSKTEEQNCLICINNIPYFSNTTVETEKKMKKEGISKQSPRVALIGRPNVGKSTLFNRLTKQKKAIVDNTPGLTRDRRFGRVTYEECAFTVIDTGGLSPAARHGNDLITHHVTGQTQRAIEESDLVVIMFDAAAGLLPEDQEILKMLRSSGKPFIAVVNKVDGRAGDIAVAEFYGTGLEEILPISARSGKGVARLIEKICGLISSPVKESNQPGYEAQADLTPSIETALDDQQDLQDSLDLPIRVCIIGRPNVGKSSLLNSIVGEDRMIVADLPGTTRDAIDTLVTRGDAPDLIFVDTAGIRRRSRVREKIEKFSVLKAIEAVKDADVAVVVLDATEGITDQDKRLIGYTAQYGKGCITVYNKHDLVKDDSGMRRRITQERRLLEKVVPYAPHLNISALTGKNVSKLLPLIDQVFQDYSFRQTTGRLNRLLKNALLRRNPPVVKGHFLKIYYVTQTGTRPPCLTFFCNYPDLFPEHYRRFLANYFRRECKIPLTPVKILFKESH